MAKSQTAMQYFIIFLTLFSLGCQEFQGVRQVASEGPTPQGEPPVGGNPPANNQEPEVNPYHTAGNGGQTGWMQDTCGTQSYQAYIPTSYVAGKPLTVVMAFHGLGDTIANFRRTLGFTDWIRLAESKGFALMIPKHLNQQRRSFLHFSGSSFDASSTQQEVEAALDCAYYGLGNHYNVDTENIVWMGFSEGASFVNFAIYSKSQALRSIIPYAGVAGRSGRNLSRKTPIYYVCGENDFSFSSIRDMSLDWQQGGHPVVRDFFAGVGHSFVDLNNRVSAFDVWAWLEANPGSNVQSEYQAN